jgi:hypothetical protein
LPIIAYYSKAPSLKILLIIDPYLKIISNAPEINKSSAGSHFPQDTNQRLLLLQESLCMQTSGLINIRTHNENNPSGQNETYWVACCSFELGRERRSSGGGSCSLLSNYVHSSRVPVSAEFGRWTERTPLSIFEHTSIQAA